MDNPNPENPRQRQADTVLATATLNGELDGEFFCWAREMYKTLDASICKGRQLVPVLVSMKQYEEETFDDTINGRLKYWMKERLEPCEPCDASDYTVVNTAVEKELGNVDKHVLTAEGLGVANRGQYRPKDCKALTFFKIKDKNGVARPCRLR